MGKTIEDRMKGSPKNLEEMLAISNARATFQTQVKLAEGKFRSSCHIVYNGGRFKLSQEFIGHLYYKNSVGATNTIVLDDTGIPVLVENISEFLDIVSSKYHEALNEYYDEFTRLRSTRRIEKLIGLE